MLSTEEIVPRLKAVKIFQHASETDLTELAEHAKVLEFEPGDFIFEQDGTQQIAYIVHKGKVSVHIDALLMSHFSEGTIFGEFSMLDGTKYSASAVAQEPTILIALDRDTFFDQLQKSRELAQRVIEYLVKRLKRHLN